MIHYTLNTGHSVEQPRAALCKEAIEALHPLAEHGGAIPGCAPFRVVVDHGTGSAVFTIWRGKEPIVTCALAWTAEGATEAWPAIEKIYLDLSDKCPQPVSPGRVAEEPASPPWIASVILPPMFLTTSREPTSVRCCGAGGTREWRASVGLLFE